MRKLILIIIILIIFSVPVAAKWSTLQKNLAISYGSFVAIDLIQSQHWIEYTENNPRVIGNYTLYEGNPFVAGKSIKTATIMALGANYLLYKFADKLESKQRTMLLIGANLIEGYVVYNNYQTMKRLGFEYKINFINFEF